LLRRPIGRICRISRSFASLTSKIFQAINEPINDLPLRLRGGSIGKISAKIPWTNILSSPLTVSIHALSLTFILVPPQPVVVRIPPVGLKLAESVTNVAETFIHEELDSRDNKRLRDSIVLSHVVDEPAERHLPGSLDPFLVDEVDNTVEDLSAEGVSVLASLTERLLSRFKLSITNTSISLVNEGSSRLEATFPEITYGAEDSGQEHSDVTGNSETRSVRILGFSVSMSDLSPSSTSFTAPSFPENPAPEDESDDDDEAAQMLMSQSIVSLSAASSVYHSVISVRAPETNGKVGHVESNVLSTKDPVVLQLTTMRPTAVPNAAHETVDSPVAIPQCVVPTITAQARLGAFACAFQDWQVGRLLALSQFLPSRSSEVDFTARTAPSLPAKEPKEAFRANFKLRSFVIVLLQDPLESTTAVDEFLARPLAPVPLLRHLHLQIDHAEADFATEPSSSSRPSQSPRLTVMDMHLFHVISLASGHESGQSWSASPIVIFNSQLSPTSKISGVGAFPYLDVTLDWERPQNSGLKPSLWRSRQLHTGITKRANLMNSQNTHALILEAPTSGNHDVEISLLPIHTFVDLQMISGWMPFVEVATASLRLNPSQHVSHDVEAEDHSGDMAFDTPKAHKSELPPDDEVPRKVDTIPVCTVMRYNRTWLIDLLHHSLYLEV
jgi:autophagy-related protein 2